VTPPPPIAPTFLAPLVVDASLVCQLLATLNHPAVVAGAVVPGPRGKTEGSKPEITLCVS